MDKNAPSTVPMIARTIGVSTRRVEYAISRYQIEPTSRVGIVRLFDSAGVAQIISAMRRIGSLKNAGEEVANA